MEISTFKKIRYRIALARAYLMRMRAIVDLEYYGIYSEFARSINPRQNGLNLTGNTVKPAIGCVRFFLRKIRAVGIIVTLHASVITIH